ncbi:MAG: ABC transporter permease [Anaerolineae bacterium]
MRPQYIAQRFLWMIVSLIGISLISFVISHLVPADPVAAIVGMEAHGEEVEMLKRKFGLDRPLHEQYYWWLVNLTRGDLGTSMHSRRPVFEDLRRYSSASAELGLAAMFLVTIVGLPLGVVAALHKDRMLDHLSRIIALMGVSMPIFWAALIAQVIFARTLGVLPADGRIDVMIGPPPQVTGLYTVDSILAGDMEAFVSACKHLIMPAACLAFGTMARLVRMVRSSMVDVLQEDYVRTARAKGLSESKVIYVHALRNALLPAATTMALLTGALMGGLFLVELMFSWPGLGFYAMRSISFIDFPAIMGVTVLMTSIYAVLNFLADLLYAVLDPRISIG